MSTCTSDANRRRDVMRDFGLAYETKNASAALRCYKSTGCLPGASAQMAHRRGTLTSVSIPSGTRAEEDFGHPQLTPL
jgi:hypothetical protein